MGFEGRRLSEDYNEQSEKILGELRKDLFSILKSPPSVYLISLNAREWEENKHDIFSILVAKRIFSILPFGEKLCKVYRVMEDIFLKEYKEIPKDTLKLLIDIVALLSPQRMSVIS